MNAAYGKRLQQYQPFSQGLTPLPFARQAATLIMAPEPYNPDPDKGDIRFWARLLHFEQRYVSIDQLLAKVSPYNILELSSGFSFRGLNYTTQHEGIHYIDTDLPGIIDTKQQLIAAMEKPVLKTNSQLETLPLNVLQEEDFKNIINYFATGPVTIVNEGLLMYLELEEKRQLCRIIHAVLEERGGQWITADIYTQTAWEPDPSGADPLSTFLASHRTEEKKFESFEAAAVFFKEEGFVVAQKAEADHKALSAYPNFRNSRTPLQAQQIKARGSIRETWCLKTAKK